MGFSKVRVLPKVLRFTPSQREQTLLIDNSSDVPIEFELAAHRSAKEESAETVSLFQSNLPSGRLSANSRDQILIQYGGDFNELDTDCVETLQLTLRNDQHELHLIVLTCEFELDETGASVIRSGKQIVRSDGLLLEEDTDAVYGSGVPTDSSSVRSAPINGIQQRKENNAPAGGGFSSQGRQMSYNQSSSSYAESSLYREKDNVRAINRIGRRACFRRLGWLSALVFGLNAILFVSLVYIIFFSAANTGWNRLIHLYGLHKSTDHCSIFDFEHSRFVIDRLRQNK